MRLKLYQYVYMGFANLEQQKNMKVQVSKNAFFHLDKKANIH